MRRLVTASQHDNFAYFNVPKYNKAMNAASLLFGSARGNAYAAANADMMKNNPPWAPLVNSNDRTFLSANVGCVAVNPATGGGGPILNMLCKK